MILKSFKCLLLFVICIFLLFFIFLQNDHHILDRITVTEEYPLGTTSVPGNYPSRNRTILLWYVTTRYINNTPHLEKLPKCPEVDCYMTTNRKYMSESQVVLFNAQRLWIDNPPARGDKDQIWVFHNQEANTAWWIHTIRFRRPVWRDKFNYTMWYRTDADFYAPFGVIVKKDKIVDKNWTEFVKGKSNKVAWMVTNCNADSRRQDYVKLLQKYVTVDIYGNCGKQKIRRDGTRDFMNLLNTTYKFYLGFENALCDDYITEKFILYYQMDIIIVVRGSGNYSKIAENGTYINTADFKSVQDLGNHLNYLMKNDTAYIEMLKRKNKYTSLIDWYVTMKNNQVDYIHWQYEKDTMCELCRRGKNPLKYKKTIDRIDLWFDQKKCYPPTDLH